MGSSRKRPRTKPPKVEEPTVAESSGKPAEAQRGKTDAGEASVTPVAPAEDVDSPLKSIMPDASSKQVSLWPNICPLLVERRTSDAVAT